MDNFKSYFSPHIWERGEGIAFSDAISITNQTSKMTEATVMGSDNYDVNIIFTNNDIQMSCTCPYALSGEYCKHMAAVLIKSSKKVDVDTGNEISQYKEELERYKKHIKTCDKEMLADFISGVLMENDHIKRAFLSKFVNEEIDVKKMISEFKEIIRYHMGYERLISYRKAHKFFNDLERYFDDLETMLKNGMVVECAKIFTSVMLGFDGLPLDDSAGYTTTLYDDLLIFVERILDENIDEANKLIYTWLEEINVDPDSWYLKDIFYDLWSSRYSDEELLNRNILMLESELTMILAAGGARDNYNLISCLMKLVRAKENRKDSITTILDLIKPYENEAEVNKYLIELAQKNDDYEEEERLILFGIEEAKKKSHYGTVNSFRVDLCKFYKRIGQTENYKAILKTLVLEGQSSLEYYLEYKGLFDHETWMSMRNGIILELTNNQLLADIYLEEDMMDYLLKWLKDNPRLDQIRLYADNLAKDYSDEVLTLFIEGLDRLAEVSGSKNHYKNIIGWMEYISKYANGEKFIEEKVDEYKRIYCRRPNFIKILNKSF